jgi:hypothetical protein
MWNDLKPYMIGTTAYVHALEKQGTDRVRETYGHKYERLTAIKAKYDPHNIFHRNVNIKPAQPGWGRVPAAGGGTRGRSVT